MGAFVSTQKDETLLMPELNLSLVGAGILACTGLTT